MINHISSKIEELKQKKGELQPQIDEINAKREKELQDVNKKYDHMIYEVNYEIQQFENRIHNELIESFVNVVSSELEIKRSTTIYSVSDQLKEFRKNFAQFEIFPEKLLEKLDKVINGDPIENIIYTIDDIKGKYLKT